MKKILLKFEVYYDGYFTPKNEIGELKLEIVMDEERIKKDRQFIESENDFDIDENDHRIPVNYTTIYVKSAKIVKKSNIKEDSEIFEYSINDDEVKLTTRGEDVVLQMGYPIPIDHYSL